MVEIVHRSNIYLIIHPEFRKITIKKHIPRTVMNIRISLHDYLSLNECFMWHSLCGIRKFVNVYMLWLIMKAPSQYASVLSSFNLCPEIVPNLSKRAFIQQEKGLCVTKTLSFISHIYL